MVGRLASDELMQAWSRWLEIRARANSGGDEEGVIRKGEQEARDEAEQASGEESIARKTPSQ